MKLPTLLGHGTDAGGPPGMFKALAGTCQEALPLLRKPPGLEFPTVSKASLQIQNSRIDSHGVPMAQRAAQSLLHGMPRFQPVEVAALPPHTEAPHLSVDASPRSPPVHVASVLFPGMEVVIQGLVKMTAFNGQRGHIQSFDVQTGRYDICLAKPAAGHCLAKVKCDNLFLVAAR